MNNTKSFLFRYFLVALAAVAWSGSASAATVARTVLNDGETVGLSNPRIAVGPNGNIHIAAQGWDPAAPGSATAFEIYYMLVSSNGTVLIDATPVSTIDTSNEGRPEIAATADNKAVITWYKSGEALRYVLVDPSGDDQSGDAALPGDILEVVETAVGTDINRGHHSIAIDSAGIVHVAKNTGALWYMAFDPTDSSVINAETTVDTSTENRPRADIAIDSDDNVHILYCSNNFTNGNCPATYMMINGADGTTLIDATQLFDAAAVEPKAAHFSIMVDSADMVHVVYGDKRNTVDADSWCNECQQGGTAIYAKLNPAADDQSGDAADMAVIRVAGDTSLGGLWYGQAFMGGDNLVHLLAINGKGGNITHVGVNPSTGAVTVPATSIDAQVGGVGWSRHYASGRGNHVVWSEGVFSTPLLNGTYQLVLASVAAFNAAASTTVVINEDDDGWFGCTLSTGKAPVDPLLPILALLALVYLSRRRMSAPY